MTLTVANMSRLLYGSSNVYRNYSRSVLGSELGLELVQCTKKTLFDSHLTSLGSLASGSLIVTSVLENFVSEVCFGLDEAEVPLFAKQQITAHVETLATAIRTSLNSLAFISPLLGRRDPGKPPTFPVFKKEKLKFSFCIFNKIKVYSY